jgi:hypothetical protein
MSISPEYFLFLINHNNYLRAVFCYLAGESPGGCCWL